MISFALQPFLGGGEFTNAVSGKIKLGKETLATIDGHWDSTVMIKEKKSGVKRFARLKKNKKNLRPLQKCQANFWHKT